MEKVTVGNTIPEIAASLRRMAELTAKASRNWDNYEQICLEALTAVYVYGKQDTTPKND